MASTGHSGTQVPQATQASVMTCGIGLSLKKSGSNIQFAIKLFHPDKTVKRNLRVGPVDFAAGS
jgi:hypothetical protein